MTLSRRDRKVFIAVMAVVAAVIAAVVGFVAHTASQAGLDEVRHMAPANLVLDSATEVSRKETPEPFLCAHSHCSRASIRVTYQADDAQAAFSEAIAALEAQEWRVENVEHGDWARLWGPVSGPWVADLQVKPVNGQPGLEVNVWMIVD